MYRQYSRGITSNQIPRPSFQEGGGFVMIFYGPDKILGPSEKIDDSAGPPRLGHTIMTLIRALRSTGPIPFLRT